MNKIWCLDDCKVVQAALLAEHQIEATLGECQDIWQSISANKNAGWLMTSNYEYVKEALGEYIESLNWSWSGSYQVPRP